MRIKNGRAIGVYCRHHDELMHGHANHAVEEIRPMGAHAHTHANTKAVQNRLARSVGHLKGIRAMVEEGRDCSEVLIQLAAVRSEINAICRIILQDHMDHCIVNAIETHNMETLGELNKAIALLLK